MKHGIKVRVINGPEDGIPAGAVVELLDRPTYDRAYPIIYYPGRKFVPYYDLKPGDLIGGSHNYNLPHLLVIADIVRERGTFRIHASPPGETVPFRDRERGLGSTTGEDGCFVSMVLAVYPYRLVYDTSPYLVNGVPEITTIDRADVSFGHFLKIGEYDLLVVDRRTSTTNNRKI